jgi:hypothetical protein
VSDEEQRQQAERARLDSQWKRKRIAAETARQMLHQAKLLAIRGELVSRRHVEKQAAFLVISLRQHLLAIATQHAGDLVNISNEHEMQEKLGAIIREKLEVLAQLPVA